MNADLTTVVGQITARIAALDKIKGRLEAALRQANAELAAMVGEESVSPVITPRNKRAGLLVTAGSGNGVLNRSSSEPAAQDTLS